jgi:hypothetical protein
MLFVKIKPGKESKMITRRFRSVVVGSPGVMIKDCHISDITDLLTLYFKENRIKVGQRVELGIAYCPSKLKNVSEARRYLRKNKLISARPEHLLALLAAKKRVTGVDVIGWTAPSESKNFLNKDKFYLSLQAYGRICITAPRDGAFFIESILVILKSF